MDLQQYQFSELAQQHGTPFYLYDMDAALAHLAGLQQHLPDCVDVYYAIKANSNEKVLQAFAGKVAGLDISSGGELELARDAGYDPASMSFAGPGKSDGELRLSVESGIHLLSVESPNELQRIIDLCASLGLRAPITLRMNPESIPRAFNMKMGGKASQFGIAQEDFEAPLLLAMASEQIDLQGIHIYAGTQCLDEDSIVENLRQTLDISHALSEKHDLTPAVINMGGGFGVPYFPGQKPLDHVSLARNVGALMRGYVAEHPRLGETRFILELGRYLMGMFGAYVARVLDIKETRGKRFAIMDGGMNHCFAATGNFGQLIKKNYPIQTLSGSEDEAIPHELVGPLCTPLDSMARAVKLPPLDVGDLIAFNNCGAYSYTASPLLFLGHPTPPELVLHQGEVQVGRPRRRITAAG